MFSCFQATQLHFVTQNDGLNKVFVVKKKKNQMEIVQKKMFTVKSAGLM